MPYTYDPTGVLPANLITEEVHLIPTEGKFGNFKTIIPVNAPYFLTSLVVKIVNLNGSKTTLTRGVDWVPCHYFGTASVALDKKIHGSLSIVNPDLTGNIVITYQTIGGDWILNGPKLASIIANINYNPFQKSWDNVAGYPDSFPAGPHYHEGFEVGNYQEMIDELAAIRAAIIARPIGVSPIDLDNAVDDLTDQITAINDLLSNSGLAAIPDMQNELLVLNRYREPVYRAVNSNGLGQHAATDYQSNVHIVAADGLILEITGSYATWLGPVFFHKTHNVNSYTLRSVNGSPFRIVDKNTDTTLIDTELLVDHGGIIVLVRDYTSNYYDVEVIQ